MEVLQVVLVYLFLALAVGYLIRKFFWPKRRALSKKGFEKECGQDDCGCH